MPYIPPPRRRQLTEHDRRRVPAHYPLTVGELVFVIFRECVLFMEHEGRRDYTARIIIYAALSGAAEEWYRRRVAPYEDEKIKQHGDVLPYDNSEPEQGGTHAR